jgi:uncharacterized membrane protein YeaQ/YmgE (transglycosylase-associated protein family)
LKNSILKFLVSKLGGILTPIIAGLIGAGIGKLATFDSNLASNIDQVAVTGFVVSFIIAAVNYGTNKIQSDGIKSIQALVNTDQDGVLGPITYTEVRKAIPVQQ